MPSTSLGILLQHARAPKLPTITTFSSTLPKSMGSRQTIESEIVTQILDPSTNRIVNVSVLAIVLGTAVANVFYLIDLVT